MELHFLTGYPKDLIRDANAVKRSGMKCTEVVERPIVETATGKLVLMAYELTFKGSVFQYLKARRIIKDLHHGEEAS